MNVGVDNCLARPRGTLLLDSRSGELDMAPVEQVEEMAR